jgi:molybdate transport system substrate-binding protein
LRGYFQKAKIALQLASAKVRKPQHLVDELKNYTPNSGFAAESSSAFAIKDAADRHAFFRMGEKALAHERRNDEIRMTNDDISLSCPLRRGAEDANTPTAFDQSAQSWPLWAYLGYRRNIPYAESVEYPRKCMTAFKESPHAGGREEDAIQRHRPPRRIKRRSRTHQMHSHFTVSRTKPLLNQWTTCRALIAALCFLAMHLAASAAEINVSAAASLTDVLQAIGGDYEKDTGDKVVFNFAGSSVLARQIEEGAPADVFFSADEAKMDALEKLGLVVAGTRKSLLSNALVIVVEKAGTAQIKDARDLAKPEVKKVALAEPSSVPAGVYAKAYLEKLGLWAAIFEKVVPTENVRAALAAVESGNVEAGFVFKTDAAISKKVRIAYEVTAAEGPKISYPVAIVKASEHAEAARHFEEYLSGTKAKAEFEKFGFVVLP